MGKQQKIDKIYEVIADKTLSFGCNVKIKIFNNNNYNNGLYKYCGEIESPLYEGSEYYKVFSKEGGILSVSDGEYHHITGYQKTGGDIKDIKIIGHPVMIGDVLDWMYESGKDGNKNVITLSTLWCEGNQRKHIDDQSDECIDFIFSLLPTCDTLA